MGGSSRIFFLPSLSIDPFFLDDGQTTANSTEYLQQCINSHAPFADVHARKYHTNKPVLAHLHASRLVFINNHLRVSASAVENKTEHYITQQIFYIFHRCELKKPPLCCWTFWSRCLDLALFCW